MNILMIGGTGLLGSAAAQLFIDKGHSVKTLSLPPLPVGAPLPKEMEIILKDAVIYLFLQQVLMKEWNFPHLFMMLIINTILLRLKGFCPLLKRQE